MIATVEATPQGTWALRVERGTKPGHYDVRADMVEPATGKVIARAEVPFDYPAPTVAARAAPTSPPTVNVAATAEAIANTPVVQTSAEIGRAHV